LWKSPGCQLAWRPEIPSPVQRQIARHARRGVEKRQVGFRRIEHDAGVIDGVQERRDRVDFFAWSDTPLPRRQPLRVRNLIGWPRAFVVGRRLRFLKGTVRIAGFRGALARIRHRLDIGRDLRIFTRHRIDLGLKLAQLLAELLNLPRRLLRLRPRISFEQVRRVVQIEHALVDPHEPRLGLRIDLEERPERT
jgi:hypothetical protein